MAMIPNEQIPESYNIGFEELQVRNVGFVVMAANGLHLSTGQAGLE